MIYNYYMGGASIHYMEKETTKRIWISFDQDSVWYVGMFGDGV